MYLLYKEPQLFKHWYKTAYSPYCSLYISYGTSKENLSKYQDISSLVIIFFILITSMLEQALIMLREISFSSLLGFKGLKVRRLAKWSIAEKECEKVNKAKI